MSSDNVESCAKCGKMFSSSQEICLFEGIKVCADCEKTLLNKQTKNKWFIWLITGICVLVAMIFILTNIGKIQSNKRSIGKEPVKNVIASKLDQTKSNNDSSEGYGIRNWGSPYSVDYNVTSRGNITTTVNGPAAKLAIILTDPKGKSESAIISKEEMITNSKTIDISMDDPQEGTWVLAVKTIDPEKVVWEKEITFSLSQLTIKDVIFAFKPNNWMGQFHGYQIGNIQIVLQKAGNLPIKFTGATFTLDGIEFSGGYIVAVLTNQESILDIPIYHCPPTKKQINENNKERSRGGFAQLPPVEAMFDSGERLLVKGKLFFSNDRTLDFEKLFIAPDTTIQNTVEQSIGVHGISPKLDDAQYYANLCKDDCSKGDYDKAINDCSKAIDMDPTLARAYSMRGWAFHKKSEFDKAIADYSKTIDLYPKYYDGYYCRGFAFYNKGDYKKAIADWSRSIELEPLNPAPYLNRSIAFCEKGDYDKAWADVEKCQELKGNVPPSFLDRLRKASGRNE